MLNTMLTVAGVVLITFAGYLPFYRNPLYADQSLFYYLGKSWLQGQVPYRDFQLMSGPHLMVLYGFFALLARDNERIVNVLTVLYVALGNVFLFLALESVWGPLAGVSASVIYAFYIFSPRLLGDRFTPETYMATPAVISLYFVFETFGHQNMIHPFLCGVALAAAAMIRQGAYFYLPATLLLMLLYTTFLSALVFVLGFALVHLFWIVFFACKGSLSPYLESTVLHAVNLALFANSEGSGKGKTDPMRRTWKEALPLVVGNSLTIFPLYLLSLTCLFHSVFNSVDVHTLTLGAMLLCSMALILTRRNFDCCYWLNSVPFASALGGVAVSSLYGSLTAGALQSWLAVFFLLGYGFYIAVFDRSLYLTTDPEKRDRILDPKRLGHFSWWPAFNAIGAYIREHTKAGSRIQVLGHAARIYITSGRRAFFRLPSFVPFKSSDSQKRMFHDAMAADYPEVIVLAGHLPAFPHNPKPYLQDLDWITRSSGIVYVEGTRVDGFPVYFADVEKSYISALLGGGFLNIRLAGEKEAVSEVTRLLEKRLKTWKAEEAVAAFVREMLECEMFENAIHAIRVVTESNRFRFSAQELESIYIALGEAQFHLGQIELAEQSFLSLIEHKSDAVTAYNNLGVIYYSQEKYEKAAAMFEKVLMQNPSDPVALDNLSALKCRLQS